MKKRINIMLMGIIALLGVYLYAGETQYATGTTSAVLTFDRVTGQRVVKSYAATSDKEGSLIKYYGGSGVVKYATSAPASTTVIPVANSDYGLTNSDTVVYCAYAGGAEYRTVSSATTTNVTLNSAITLTQGASDSVHEVELIYQVAVGAASVADAGDAIIYAPGGSPLYVVLDGTSACWVAVTTTD